MGKISVKAYVFPIAKNSLCPSTVPPSCIALSNLAFSSILFLTLLFICNNQKQKIINKINLDLIRIVYEILIVYLF